MGDRLLQEVWERANIVTYLVRVVRHLYIGTGGIITAVSILEEMMWPSPVFRFMSGCRKGPPTIYHVVTLHSSQHCMHDPSVQPQDVRCIPDGSRTAPPRKRKKASNVSGRRRTTGVTPIRGGFFS